MYTRSERPERQQRQNREPRRVGTEVSLHSRQQHQIYENQECEPVQRLRHHQTLSRGAVACVWPARADADRYNERDENFPVAFDRLSRESGIGNAEDSQDEHQAERQFVKPEARALALD